MSVDAPAISELVDAHELGAPAAPRREGPWWRAWAKLRRDGTALAAAVVLVLIVLASLLAPFYASMVSGPDPFRAAGRPKIVIAGKACR